MGDSRVRIVLGAVRKLAAPVLSGTSFMNRFVEERFPLDRKVVSYNSSPVPKITINNLPEEPKDKNDEEQDVIN